MLSLGSSSSCDVEHEESTVRAIYCLFVCVYRFEQIEKEIQQVKDATDEKIADMAVALVVTHDFQVS